MMVHPHVWIMGGEGRGCHGVNRGAQVWGVPHCTAHRCHPTPSSWFALKLSSPSSPPSLSHSLPPMHMFSPGMHLFLPPCATHVRYDLDRQVRNGLPSRLALPPSPLPLPHMPAPGSQMCSALSKFVLHIHGAHRATGY